MKDPAFAKFVLLINGAVPLALLCWDAYWNQLGPDRISAALHTTGTLALIFLMLSLAITPVRKFSGWNWLSHFRRMLGLYAFFYGSLHFLIYFTFDRSLSIASVIADTVRRPFILFGMACLLLMIPLAITSTNGMIKRLGAPKWKRLHQLVYVAAIAGVLHYEWLVKADHRIPNAFAALLAVLFAYRLLVDHVPWLRKQKIAPTQARRAAA
jgi:DMSO/TMAO reductase YedYZ heme-binding membrane subunit